jgi:hypothetical protein
MFASTLLSRTAALLVAVALAAPVSIISQECDSSGESQLVRRLPFAAHLLAAGRQYPHRVRPCTALQNMPRKLTASCWRSASTWKT